MVMSTPGVNWVLATPMTAIHMNYKPDSDGRCECLFVFILQAGSLQVKEEWVRTIKVLLMESLPHLPDKVSYVYKH